MPGRGGGKPERQRAETRPQYQVPQNRHRQDEIDDHVAVPHPVNAHAEETTVRSEPWEEQRDQQGQGGAAGHLVGEGPPPGVEGEGRHAVGSRPLGSPPALQAFRATPVVLRPARLCPGSRLALAASGAPQFRHCASVQAFTSLHCAHLIVPTSFRGYPLVNDVSAWTAETSRAPLTMTVVSVLTWPIPFTTQDLTTSWPREPSVTVCLSRVAR